MGRIYVRADLVFKKRGAGRKSQWSPGENPGRESGHKVPQKLKYFCLNHIFDISGSLVTNCIKHKQAYVEVLYCYKAHTSSRRLVRSVECAFVREYLKN